MSRCTKALWLLAAGLVLLAVRAASGQAFDKYRDFPPSLVGVDHSDKLHVRTREDVLALREVLRAYLWQSSAWPDNRLPDRVELVYDKNDPGGAAGPRVRQDLPGLVLWLASPPPALPDLPGLLLRLDANDEDSVRRDADGLVEEWRDKSGNAYHFRQVTAMRRPRYESHGIGGRPTVRFDGESAYLQTPAADGLNVGNVSLFLVLQVDSLTNASNPVLLAKLPVNEAYQFHVKASNGLPGFRVRQSEEPYRTARNGVPVAAGDTEIWSGICDNGAVTFYRQGEFVDTKALWGPRISATEGSLRLGCGDNWNHAFCGGIAEVLAYERALTSEERGQVEAYLSGKYGIPLGSLNVMPYNLPPADIDKVYRLTIGMDHGMCSYAYLFEPESWRDDRRRLIVLHGGHASRWEGNLDTALSSFLGNGYAVMSFSMPLVGENLGHAHLPDSGTVTLQGHDAMPSELNTTEGIFIKYFLEPVVVGINSWDARTDDPDPDITMIGLSGGGWTTVVCAALDPRIRLSFSVAGSSPLYIRRAIGMESGDAEQSWPDLYQDEDYPRASPPPYRVNYMDLYIMGSGGAGRRQVEIRNQFDSCCHWGVAHGSFMPAVTGALEDMGAGERVVYLDSTHEGHELSAYALQEWVWPEILAFEQAGAR